MIPFFETQYYGIVYQLAYRNIPLMSTSLTEASTIGILTSGAPRPTSTRTPPERVACTGVCHNNDQTTLYIALHYRGHYIDCSGNAGLCSRAFNGAIRLATHGSFNLLGQCTTISSGHLQCIRCSHFLCHLKTTFINV